jgi:hypothetical protein
MDEILNT